MTCEELRIQKNKAYIKYSNETDITEKMRLLNWWKACLRAYEDAYRQEIKGE